MKTHTLSAVSFRDPAGFVYQEHGSILRQVNTFARDHYDHLMRSGLYQELTALGLLIPHEESDAAPRDPDVAYKVIRPELIDFVSYPYEWSFSQYKDAALLTLAVQRHAVGRGMSLKDCSAYNVQFRAGRPILIDTLSLELYREEKPWVAYRQFCQHFLAPLALMSLVDNRLNQLCRTNLDGVPLDLATRLLPWRSRLRFGLSLHLHLHGMVQRAGAGAAESATPGRFGRKALLGLVDSLETTIRGLRWRPGRSSWVRYYDENSYTQVEIEHKRKFIRETLDLTGPAGVWDLGANTGCFSRLCSDRGISTVAFDFDPDCVETNYREVRKRGGGRLLPLLNDILDPSPSSGWANRERTAILQRGKPDLILALALIHHLAIAGNLPLENLAEFFHGLGPWLVIEFVDPDDPQARQLMARRGGVHHPYSRAYFEKCFRRYFSLEMIKPLPGIGRTLYLMRRRDRATVIDG
jgi:hypothetical protein